MPGISEVWQRRTAHHEPGHITIAADQGLSLRPEGIMIDQSGFGFGCYDKDPWNSDAVRRRILLATFAGYFAERRFCKQQGLEILDEDTWFLHNPDGRDEAVPLVKAMAIESLSRGSVPATFSDLKSQSKSLVDRKWNIIEAIARALLAKSWEPIKSLPSGGKWWNDGQTMGKYLPGEEVVRILAQHGIAAYI
jgi:hypothetical protein